METKVQLSLIPKTYMLRLGNDETFYQTYIPLPSIQFQQSNLVVVAGIYLFNGIL
jgi:hypothetical protein